MNSVIQQTSLLLIKIMLLSQLISCNEIEKSASKNPFNSYQQGEITLPSGKRLKVYMAVSDEQQQMGLSHIKLNEFADDETMLFTGTKDSTRQFWMPDTFFNLDIIFLNEDLYVLDIHRNLQHFPKSGPRSEIPLSKKVYCQHVLEIKSTSPWASEIQPGMILNWSSPKNLLQIK